MSTFTQLYYHIVFAVKDRVPALETSGREPLYRYINGIFKNNKCLIYQINGTEDHVHILCDIHPTIALAEMIKDLKISSNKWIKEKGLFPKFEHWQEGYAAFTHSSKDKMYLMKYITNQPKHHQHVSFQEELRNLLNEAGIEFDEKYLW